MEAETSRGDPYCGQCGYDLTGVTDSARCPECGRPLVEVLMRPVLEAAGGGKRFRTRARLLGLPVVDIAFGPHGHERIGRARGFIALGDVATGVLAIGGQARGAVAIGGLAMGGLSFGGASIGLVNAIGGCALGGTAIGGFAAGGLARGGASLGVVADGGMAVGHWVRGGAAFGRHRIDAAGASSQAAADVFDSLGWFFGPWPPTVWSFAGSLVSAVGALLVAAGLVALLAAWAYARRTSEPAP